MSRDENARQSKDDAVNMRQANKAPAVTVVEPDETERREWGIEGVEPHDQSGGHAERNEQPAVAFQRTSGPFCQLRPTQSTC